MAVSANRLEILQIAESVAREKGIEKEIVLNSMEHAMQKAARSRYGIEHDIRAVIDEADTAAFRARAMTPDKPTLRGTAQNPDVYFQGREAVNPFYATLPATVQAVMDKFAAVTGRSYHLFDYYGAPDAERIIVTMGSSCETVEETIDFLFKKGVIAEELRP